MDHNFNFCNISMHDNQITPSNVVIVHADPKPLQDDVDSSLIQLSNRAEAHGHVMDLQVDKGHGRIRIVYDTVEDGTAARTYLNGASFDHFKASTSFGKRVVLDHHVDHLHLQVPEQPRQFLISPPASPPVGWEPVEEDPPVVDHALVDRLMSMQPNTPHVIQPADPKGRHPAIAVMDCSSPECNRRKLPALMVTTENSRVSLSESPSNRTKAIPQTQCPPRL
eukprot:TRINITY_DN9770_c0_g1_i2.p1 TRINITY_DN9770_c0_g1~~TRINITY_DN9770_c0_g1_i2.p1  ORF type:complete len:223 (+),score=24.13 TRINITY_DN9770_c0_g1_i2:61-729(+)